jgi:catechol 2,3-dioxygenase-like lactoylglutathione lyase family enzyme
MDARIRYVALTSEQPERLAGFYKTHFGLTELGHAGGEVALTDGFYNVSILKPRGDAEPGFSHFGIAVDDVNELEARLEDAGANADLRAEEGGLLHGEYRLTDPHGLTVSLSTTGFGVPAGRRGLPAIRHVAISVPNNDEMLGFYQAVFGFREPRSSVRSRERGSQSRFAADGSTALAILRYPVDQDVDQAPPGGWPARHFREGLNHIGFLVNDIEGFLARLPESSVSKRPAARPMTEYRALDPEANEIDVSQHKGYEVDVDVWEHA